MVKLKALRTFAGVHGNAAAGQEFEVSADVAKAMIADKYPVEKVEVKTNGRKRTASVKPAAGDNS